MSTALTGLAGDVASFYNISQDEAYTKLKSVFSGETETLKDLGIVMTQNALDEYAMANGFGKVTSAMSEAEKVSLRYAFVQSQLTNAAGDFTRTQDSWANQTRILALQFDSLKASIGQGFIQILTPVIRALNVLMGKLVQAANKFRDFTATLFGKQTAAKQKETTAATMDVNDGLSQMGSSAGKAAGSTNKVNKSLKKTSKAAKELKRSLAGFDQITKLAEKTKSSSTPVSTGTGGIGGGISSGGGGISSMDVDTGDSEKKASLLSKAWDKVAESLQRCRDAFSRFGKIAGKILKFVWDNLLKPFGKWIAMKLVPAIADLFGGAVDIVAACWEACYPIMKFVWKKILIPIFKLIGKSLIKALKTMADWLYKIADIIRKTTGKIKDFISAIKELPEKIKDALESLKDHMPGLDELGADISEGIGEVKVKISAWFADKKEDVQKKWADITENIKDKTVTLTSSVKEKVKDALKTLKGKWDAIKSKTSTITSSVKEKTKGALASMKKKWDAIKSKTATMSLKFSAAASDLKKWINSNVIDRVNSKFKQVPILKNHLIPHLAQGGYVRANQPQLAMIGDNKRYGEFVAPENKMMAMAMTAAQMAGGGNDAVLRQILNAINTIGLSASVDMDKLSFEVSRKINQRTKASGRCEIRI